MAELALSVSASAESLLSGLDDEQRAAVTHVGGPALVLAGPGAGKTRTLTHRVAYLVSTGVPASRILVCTFTRKATNEMESRLADLIGAALNDLHLGTIHAICYRLLREQWRANGRTLEVISDSMAQTIVGMILDRRWAKNELGLDLARRRVRAQDLFRFFAACRDQLLAPGEVPPERVPDLVGPRWQEIADECRAYGLLPASPQEWIEAYRLYQEAKLARDVVDFDDMGPLLWSLWREDPGLLARHQRRFEHVLIDEFQDTSYGQWAVLRKLAEPENNIFAVGDADQSIYSFRFARPEFTVRFRDYYPDAKLYPVLTNYRSVAKVVDISSRLIGHNRERVPLSLRPRRSDDGLAEIIHPEDDDDEAEILAERIARDHGGRWDDAAILYRVNRYSAKVELALLRHGIPYKIVGGLSFFAYRPVADMLAYLRLAEDPGDGKAFARALQAPSRFLGKEFVRAVQAHAGVGGSLIDAVSAVGAAPRQKEAAEEFARLIHRLPVDPSSAVRMVRESTGYDAWFLQRGQQDDEDEYKDRLGILDELEDVASGFDTRAELLAYADTVLEAAGNEDEKGRVTLTTIHRAKGLEWPVVYVAGMVDGLLPHARAYAVGLGAIEEERRIAYVAMTRAKDRLVLSVPYEVGGRPVDPSPFLREAGL
jgi:DNA helicase-2/ATP-dependent DNA helicase PcrA